MDNRARKIHTRSNPSNAGTEHLGCCRHVAYEHQPPLLLDTSQGLFEWLSLPAFELISPQLFGDIVPKALQQCSQFLAVLDAQVLLAHFRANLLVHAYKFMALFIILRTRNLASKFIDLGGNFALDANSISIGTFEYLIYGT